MTADALHCQRATAEYLHRRGADFILLAKDKQPGPFDALDALPWRDVPVACAAGSRGRTKSGPRAMATFRNLARTREQPYGTHPFRAAGSAGGRSPLALYVAVSEGLSQPAGAYWHSPLEHALAQVGTGRAQARPSPAMPRSSSSPQPA